MYVRWVGIIVWNDWTVVTPVAANITSHRRTTDGRPYDVLVYYNNFRVKFFAELFFKKATRVPASPRPRIPASLWVSSELRYGELYEQTSVVGGVALESRLVSSYFPALLTTVNYHKALFGVGFCTDRFKCAAAFICPVSRIYVNVY